MESEFNAKIHAHLRHYYWDCLGLYDWNKRIDDRKNEIPRAKAWLKAIEKISDFDLKNKKMLDIGSGWGGHIIAGAQLGAICVGCDVDEEVIEVARLRTRLCGVEAEFVRTAAEKLPFADNEFDYVQSVSVLEHVQDVLLAVKELVRVLKPGGVGFVHAPNYFIPIEPHYKIIFPSKCPKSIAKIYLRLLARPADFIDTINYIDYRGIKSLFESSGAVVSDILNEFKTLSSDYSLEGADCGKETVKAPIRSYNALMGKLMGRGSVTVRNFFQIMGIRNIYFMLKKQSNETRS
ncbi:MAG: class I SAM-dependent methyltransferase [Phycisphaerae bacterium]